MSNAFYFGFWLQVFLSSFYQVSTCEQRILTDQTQLRNATLDDADKIATIIVAAFEPMPHWQYLYQFRHSFPEGHRECVRYGISQMLSNPDSNTEVIAAPQGSDIPLVAVAMWTQNHSASPSMLFELGAPDGCYKSLNITRALDWMRKASVVEREYIHDVFGEQQVYLSELATHPAYQLRGAGTQLVSRGIERGRKGGVNVTLLALPTAEGFYLKRGFREVRNISLESVDGDESFGYNVMAYDFDNNESR